MGARCIANVGGDHVDLAIEGVIGDLWWTDDPVTAASIGKLLKAAPNAKTMTVAINSEGGSFFDGVQIYQLLSEHPARVTVKVGALAASAASIVAMAGDEIIAHETSNLLVHRPWTWADGNEDDLRRVADDLRALNETLVVAYVARTGMSEEAIRALLIEDRYMGAKEALELGFVTSVLPSKTKETVTQEQARASLDRLRSQVRSRRHLAAATNTTPAPSAKEKDNVNLALIIAALGIAASATEEQVDAEVRRLKASDSDAKKLYARLGVSNADEATGVVVALEASCESGAETLQGLGVKLEKGANPAATAIATIEAFATATEKSERASVIAKLRAECRVTPAQERDLLPALNLTALKAFAESAPKVALLQPSTLREPGNASSTLASKPFSEMTPAEQRELNLADPNLYDELKRQSEQC